VTFEKPVPLVPITLDIGLIEDEDKLSVESGEVMDPV
jgi:hypothetical protein